MYRHIALAALAAVSLPFAASQLMDLDAIAAAPDPVIVTPPVAVTQNIPADVPAPPIVPLTTDVPSKIKRSRALFERDGDCSPQPQGSGPVPTPDTVDAFEAYPTFAVSTFPLFEKETTQNLPGHGVQRAHSRWLCSSFHRSGRVDECPQLYGSLHPDELRHSELRVFMRPGLRLRSFQHVH